MWLRTVGGADHLPDQRRGAGGYPGRLAGPDAPRRDVKVCYAQAAGRRRARSVLADVRADDGGGPVVPDARGRPVGVPPTARLRDTHITPVLRARLQELFGMAETPHWCPK